LAEDWQFVYPPIQSDHKMVTVKAADTEAPHLGRGRWLVPQRLLNNRPFLKEIEAKGKEILETARSIECDNTQRTMTVNAQKLWDNWKSFVIENAKDKAKKKTTYLERLSIATENEIKTANNDSSNETPSKSQYIAELEQRRREIEIEKTLTKKTTIQCPIPPRRGDHIQLLDQIKQGSKAQGYFQKTTKSRILH
jgi:hypothetical protein